MLLGSLRTLAFGSMKLPTQIADDDHDDGHPALPLYRYFAPALTHFGYEWLCTERQSSTPRRCKFRCRCSRIFRLLYHMPISPSLLNSLCSQYLSFANTVTRRQQQENACVTTNTRTGVVEANVSIKWAYRSTTCRARTVNVSPNHKPILEYFSASAKQNFGYKQKLSV